MTYEAARDAIAHHSTLESTNRRSLLAFLQAHPEQAREIFRVDAAHRFLPAHRDGELLCTAALRRNLAKWLVVTGQSSTWARFHAARADKATGRQ